MVEVERSDVATAILELVDLGAPINRRTVARIADVNLRTKDAKSLDTALDSFRADGLLEGDDPKKVLTVAKGAVSTLRSLTARDQEWMAEADALIEAFAHHLPNIDLVGELNKHPGWFREARLPWLHDDRFFLRGINRRGDVRDRQPLNGWTAGVPPEDWIPPIR
jgi:hypothetical protein